MCYIFLGMRSQEKSRDKLTSDIGLLMAIASQLFTTRVGQVIGTTGLTYTQFSMLNHLEVHPDASISDLAAAMEINQPGVSKVVQRLSDLTLVDVRPDPNDSRRKRVSLAAPGTEALKNARAALGVDGEAWFSDWSKDDLASFRNGLAQLTTWLDNNRLDPG